jgi:hypothetical protein
MADKPRVTAPKQRATQRRADQEAEKAKRRRLVMLGGGAVAVLLAIGGIVARLGLGGSEPSPAEVRAQLKEAGCTMQVKGGVANVSSHTDFPDPEGRSEDWNTDPPTSGPHYGGTLIYGSYREPVDIGRVLHNLEHGAVYILYGNKVPEETIAQLQEFYDDHQNGTILAPYARLGKRIALGVWVVPGLPEATGDRGSGVLARCTRYDAEAFDAFFDAFQFKGPESSLFLPSSMKPGNN